MEENNPLPNPDSKIISCCQLLTLLERYYRKKFGADGLSLFGEEIASEEFLITQELTNSLFLALEKRQ